VFTALLRSNERVADHRRHRSSIVSCSLPREPVSKLFRLTGVMSQHKEEKVYDYLSMVCHSHSVIVGRTGSNDEDTKEFLPVEFQRASTLFKSVLLTTEVNPDLEMILVWSY
jgi:hypothetical protein